MMKRTGFAILFLIGATFLPLGDAWGGGSTTYRPNAFGPHVTAQHTSYGVSQFMATHEGTSSPDYQVKLSNPGPYTHIVSILIYQSAQQDTTSAGGTDYKPDDLDIEAEKFLGCVNLRLTPHSSIRVNEELWEQDLVPADPGSDSVILLGGPRPGIDPNDERSYFEVISVPEDKQYVPGSNRVRTRYADGFGIIGGETDKQEFVPVHPGLFNLPEDPSQQQAALDCLCDAAKVVGDRYVWQDFGVACSSH